MLSILYQDEHYVAIYKPAGLLVHRTGIAYGEREFALQQLRDQIGRHVFPIHRLDRPTAGLLLFALTPAAARVASELFQQRHVRKRYLALVRGYPAQQDEIDYPLRDENRLELRSAQTQYRRLARLELPIPVDRYLTARSALVEVQPRTGRYHQIRRHFAHIRHPVIGDTSHGDRHHNRLFREHFGMHRLLLVATTLSFRHPYSGVDINIETRPDGGLCELIGRLDWLPDERLEERELEFAATSSGDADQARSLLNQQRSADESGASDPPSKGITPND